MNQIWYTCSMKIISVNFYKTSQGTEPVRQWLLSLKKDDKKIIGQDVKTVEFGWPLGMPLVRKLDKSLWEVRSDISDGRISRVIFTVEKSIMILLHGFIKKTQKTSTQDINLAKVRRNEVLNG